MSLGNLMPSNPEVQSAVRGVLEKTAVNKDGLRCYLTAYQILDRLPDVLKKRLISERGLGGKETGVEYAATGVVSDAAELIKDIDIEYIDPKGMEFNVDNQQISSGGRYNGLYRLRLDA